MATNWINADAMSCPCPNCHSVVDYTSLHPTHKLPHVINAQCRDNHHIVELTFNTHSGPPSACCLS